MSMNRTQNGFSIKPNGLDRGERRSFGPIQRVHLIPSALKLLRFSTNC